VQHGKTLPVNCMSTRDWSVPSSAGLLQHTEMLSGKISQVSPAVGSAQIQKRPSTECHQSNIRGVAGRRCDEVHAAGKTQFDAFTQAGAFVCVSAAAVSTPAVQSVPTRRT
jgi:hypothetical protein